VAEPLLIHVRDGLGLATVMARKGRDAAAVGAALRLAAPESPAYARGEGVGLVGTGPGMWLAIGEGAESDWAESLAERLQGIASVSDQSGAYIVFRLAGPGARALLQQGIAIDLDPAVFGPGAAATSVIAHIGVILWSVDAETFDVAIFRSYAASFRHWIEATAAPL
jgi:methylglutamate dehydrogenase subunit D